MHSLKKEKTHIKNYKMSYCKLTDENIASHIDFQYVRMKHFEREQLFMEALNAKRVIKSFINHYLRNHPEPFSPTLLGSNKISYPDSLSREFSYRYQ